MSSSCEDLSLHATLLLSWVFARLVWLVAYVWRWIWKIQNGFPVSFVKVMICILQFLPTLMGPYLQERNNVDNVWCHFPLTDLSFLVKKPFVILAYYCKWKKLLHAGTTTALFALDCLPFRPFEGLSVNNRNSYDKLSSSSKDSEVLELLPMTDDLSLLITCHLGSVFVLSAKSPSVCSWIL